MLSLAIMELITKQETAVVIDHKAIGAILRGKREKAGITIREIARRLGKSAPYIGDLELGRRNWSQGILTSYEVALKEDVT